MPPLALFVLPPVLAWSCASDLLYRRISNQLVFILLLLWLLEQAFALALGPATSAVVLGQAARALPGALAVLVVGFGLFRLNRVGAGDVKLAAVLCLWVGAAQQTTFLIVTSLAGGLLALLLPLLGVFEQLLARFWWQAVQWLPVRYRQLPQCLGEASRPGIPYALALCIGVLFTLFVPLSA
ncbi:MAG: hypothetical protein GAK45_00805 [Pseudomonas citronellolis]|nr:MAG: hypothetical protein GAK45_00805 [Pseudomonas citronellolis]